MVRSCGMVVTEGVKMTVPDHGTTRVRLYGIEDEPLVRRLSPRRDTFIPMVDLGSFQVVRRGGSCVIYGYITLGVAYCQEHGG
jgi:hypothetical protein